MKTTDSWWLDVKLGLRMLINYFRVFKGPILAVLEAALREILGPQVPAAQIEKLARP